MKILTLVFSVAAVLLVGCKREQAVWQSDWQLPVINDTLTLNQLEDSGFVTVNGGYYELSLDRTLYEVKLSDIVEIPDTTIKNYYAIPLNGINVNPGVSFVNNVEEHAINMGDVQLKKIRVKSGGVSLKLESPIETGTIITIQLPGVTNNGVTFSQTFYAPAGTNEDPGIVTDYLDLTGFEMDLRGPDQDSYNRIQSKLQVKTDPNGSVVNVTNLDTVRFEATMNDLLIDYARGYFGSQLFTDTITENVDFFDKITSGIIDLPASNLQLEIENGIKLSAKAKITTISNTNNQQNTVDLTHPMIGNWLTISSATGNEQNLNPSVTTLTFDGGNSNMEQYMENHGAKNTIGFELQLNPWGNISGGWDEIFPQSALKVKLKGDMPLAIGLDDVVLRDTFDFSFQQDVDQSHVSSGVLWLKATNAFPLNAQVTLYLMDAGGGVVASINASDIVESSVYGQVVNGILQKQSYVEFDLPESILSQLNDVKQLAMKVKMNTPNASTNQSEQVQIPEGAFFGVKVGAKLKLEARI